MPIPDTQTRKPDRAPVAAPSGEKKKIPGTRFLHLPRLPHLPQSPRSPRPPRFPRFSFPVFSHRQKHLAAVALFLAASLGIGLFAALRGQEAGSEWNPLFSLHRNELRLLTSEPPYSNRNDIFVESGKANEIDAAVYERNRAVENLLDVRIRRSYTTDAVGVVRKMTLAEVSAADLIAIEYGGDYATLTVSQVSPLLDLTEVEALDLSDPCYNADVLRDLSLGGRLYAVTGDSLYSSLDALYVTVFDRARITEMNRDGSLDGDLQDLALAGDWTLDLFAMLGKNTPGMPVADGDSLLALCSALGERSVKNDGVTTPQVTILSDGFRSVFRRIQTLLTPQSLPPAAETAAENESAVSVSTLGNYLEKGSALYGILPMPKADKRQSQYITPSDSTDMQSFGILSASGKTDLAARVLQALMQESAGITEAYESAITALDPRGGEILPLLKRQRVYDLGTVCRWGNFSEGLELVFSKDETAYDTVMGERATAAEFSVKLAWERATGDT